ncbi:MAG: carbamoyltransferase HypF [Planctomycetaceae bacterium]|nr:MAG: carbamoyltransferase HypF [Planctomycetaceae bacterium]
MPAIRITLHGQVQGFGVRPAIAQLATRCGLDGTVRNSTIGVVIELRGELPNLERFRDSLSSALPEQADVTAIDEVDLRKPSESPPTGFRILASDRDGAGRTHMPVDSAICAACLVELTHVAESNEAIDRRFGYPLITCTRCGPRFSLIRAMPYDRSETSMDRFTPCPECAREYVDPTDRRFHSQTNACEACGPRVRLVAGDGQEVAAGAAAVAHAAKAILNGKIVGVLGVGGYQWVVDATQPAAVERLRRRKGRPTKPLAIMLADVDTVASLAVLAPAERLALSSAANPIVLLSRRPDPGPISLAHQVTGPMPSVGVMLPTTGLHHLLLNHLNGRPLVVTSGNRDGEPLRYRPQHPVAKPAGQLADGVPREGVNALNDPDAEIADCWLDHDREILRPIDDSVVRVIAGRTATIRLARGLAPLPLSLPPAWLGGHAAGRQVVAMGGHQKAAIALFDGSQAVLGPHVGDLEDESTRERYLQSLESLLELYRVRPDCWVHDAHPDYFTSRLAQQLTETSATTPQGIGTGPKLPVDRAASSLAIQHHHAHVAATMLEQGWLERTVLGVAWDGTGDGTDGTVWGGEFLIVNGKSCRRFASLLPFRLVGGDAAVRQPWRVAVALVHQALGPQVATGLKLPGIDPLAIARIVQRLERPAQDPRSIPPSADITTTSAGRLLDGFAALTLGITHSDYDAEPAMRFESIADDSVVPPYPIRLVQSQPTWRLDWTPTVRSVIDAIANRVPAAIIAARVHRALAHGIRQVIDLQPSLPVALCGGCFQNRLLTEAVVTAPECCSRAVATPGQIPTSDGGLAAGQLAIALAPDQQPD